MNTELYFKRRPQTKCVFAVKIQSMFKTLTFTFFLSENNIKFNTLSASVTEELGSFLNAKQGKNWKHLAGLMGYNSVFTQNLELTPVDATQRLLQDWEHGSDATVYQLYLYLRQLGRDDAIAVLLPFLTSQGGSREEFV